jgi:hypothetical protein
MPDRLSESCLSGKVGPRGGATRYFVWTALGLAFLLLGLYRLFLLERADPCQGPFFVLCGCLALTATWFSAQRTVVWFACTDNTLRYRLVSRSAIRDLPISEIISLQSLVRPRRNRPYGFAILRRGGGKLCVEYDVVGHAMRLERALNARLNCEGQEKNLP